MRENVRELRYCCVKNGVNNGVFYRGKCPRFYVFQRLEPEDPERESIMRNPRCSSRLLTAHLLIS